MRIFLLIPYKNVKECREIKKELSVIGKILSLITYENSPINELTELLDVIAKKYNTDIDIQKQLILNCYLNKSMQVAIIKSNNNLSDFDQSTFLKTDSIADYQAKEIFENLMIISPDLADELGGIFFWKKICNKKIFHTNNSNLFKYEYLPVLLSKKGKGIFFEERIINRIKELKFIKTDDKVLKIIDSGGWEDINNLTAKLEIVVGSKDKTYSSYLLADALVPCPPVRPEELSDKIQKRMNFLKSFGIMTAVLHAEDGVVYRMKIDIAFREFIKKKLYVNDENLISILSSAAEIAALTDNGCHHRTTSLPFSSV